MNTYFTYSGIAPITLCKAENGWIIYAVVDFNPDGGSPIYKPSIATDTELPKMFVDLANQAVKIIEDKDKIIEEKRKIKSKN